VEIKVVHGEVSFSCEGDICSQETVLGDGCLQRLAEEPASPAAQAQATQAQATQAQATQAAQATAAIDPDAQATAATAAAATAMALIAAAATAATATAATAASIATATSPVAEEEEEEEDETVPLSDDEEEAPTATATATATATNPDKSQAVVAGGYKARALSPVTRDDMIVSPAQAQAQGGQGADAIVQGMFSLRILCLFSKCSALSSSVELYLRNDYPLIVRYQVANLGEIKLVLAQRQAE
jgi:hypothetical protein